MDFSLNIPDQINNIKNDKNIDNIEDIVITMDAPQRKLTSNKNNLNNDSKQSSKPHLNILTPIKNETFTIPRIVDTIHTNTPIPMSANELQAHLKKNEYVGSEYEHDEDDDSDNSLRDDVKSTVNSIGGSVINLQEIMNKIPPPRKIGFNDVKSVVRETFFSDDDYNSTAFDIISTYIKGQKILYMEAMSHCSSQLNVLMMPTIMLSAIATVLSLTIDTFFWGPILVASVNAFNGFLLAVVNYSKLDAASEAHKITSHQYDKLQSLCEFTSGRLMMMSKMNRKDEFATIQKTMNEVESKIKDIKETNSFVIPSTIRSRFMNIYYLNIFTVVKKIRDNESLLINELKDKLNQVRSYEYLNKIGFNHDSSLNDKIIVINKVITALNGQIIKIKTNFINIDKMFKIEMRQAAKMKRRGWFVSSCCYTFSEDHEYDILDGVTDPSKIQHSIELMRAIQ